MSDNILDDYARVAGQAVVDHLRQLSGPLKGLRVVHVNSTRTGGGVAEILHKMVPLMRELGIDAGWEVITGEADFYSCTKTIHNALQGNRVNLTEDQQRIYEETNASTAEGLRRTLADADIVVLHDPQPAALAAHFPSRRGRWVWRCHIDMSRPYRPVWKYLRSFVAHCDASIFSLSSFAQPLPHPAYLIPPSIDPLHAKNVELDAGEINGVRDRFNLPPDRPLVAQISRYDRFKDPLGVIEAYRLAKVFVPRLQLVLAGGGASDDPEGAAVLEEVRRVAESEDDGIHVLLLPEDAHRTVNALQRAADVVIQKSVREGFGLTVSEAMWKEKPVIGGDAGGIRIQVINHHTGFLVNTPEGAALRIRHLLHHREQLADMGRKAREYVRRNFLITRHLREYLTLFVALLHGKSDRIELG